MSFAASSQTFISEDFNSRTLGQIGGQGNWEVYPDPLPEAQVINLSSGDNALQMTGSATTGSKYVYQTLDISTRTSGNDVIATEFILKTGSSTTSLNNFILGFYDAQLELVFGLRYTPSNHIVDGLIYDTDATYLSKLGASNTDATLLDDATYYVYMYYNIADKQAYWLIYDSNNTMVCVKGTSYSSAADITEMDIIANAGTGNAASTNAVFDDVLVKARPCLLYDTKDNVSFSYSASALCNTASALAPTKVDNNVTGVFSSTPAGLTIDATTGAITPSTSTAGTYTVQFASNVANTCDDSTTVSFTINDCSGLPEHYSSAFSVAPNPANQFVNVTLADNVFEGTIRLITSEGKEVEVREVSENKTETFNVSNLEKGIYFIQLGDKIEKVVVQ